MNILSNLCHLKTRFSSVIYMLIAKLFLYIIQQLLNIRTDACIYFGCKLAQYYPYDYLIGVTFLMYLHGKKHVEWRCPYRI